MNPYEAFFSNPELYLFHTAVVLIIGAWIFLSSRYMVTWGVELLTRRKDWRGDVLPPKKDSKQIAAFLVTLAINLLLLGAFVHLAT